MRPALTGAGGRRQDRCARSVQLRSGRCDAISLACAQRERRVTCRISISGITGSVAPSTPCRCVCRA